MAVNAAPITATDSLSQALKANIIPNQEYLLQVCIIYCIFLPQKENKYLNLFYLGFGVRFSRRSLIT